MNETNLDPKYEYDLLKGWYDEWTKINKTFVFLSLTIIAFTISIYGLGDPDTELDAQTMGELRAVWTRLFAASIAAGCSICTAYVWMDVIRRERLPHLAGEVFTVKYGIRAVWIGAFGWVFSISAVLALLYGVLGLGHLAFEL